MDWHRTPILSDMGSYMQAHPVTHITAKAAQSLRGSWMTIRVQKLCGALLFHLQNAPHVFQ